MTAPRFAAIAQDLLAATHRPQEQTNLFPLIGGRFSGGEKWRGGMSASGRGAIIDHAVARQNARAMMHESTQGRAIVERKADTVADGGLRLEMAPITEILGISREYATTWARDFDARFHLWAKSKRQHRAEKINFYQSQCQYQLFSQRDNEQFVRLFYENDPRLLNPLQFDFVDPDQVRGSGLTSTSAYFGQQGYTSTNGLQISATDGIIRDERGREIAYKVWVREKDGGFKEVEVPAMYPGNRIGMIHAHSSEYAGQGRGYSRFAHAVQDLEKITDFSATVIQRAINQSNIVGFVKTKGEDSVNPISDFMDGDGAGPAAQYLGSDPQALDGLPAPDPQPLERFYQVPEATFRTPGGLFIGNLKKDAEIVFPQNSAPGDSYDKFVDAFCTYISASTKTPLEVVLMKFGQNYSASRATLLLFYRVICIERDEMATEYLWPIVEMWACGEIAAGRIIAPGWSDPRLRAAWLNGSWIGSGPPDIDPAKSAKADRDRIEIGSLNAEAAARNYNGSSAADNIAKNNDTFKDYKALPWNEVGNPPPGAAPAPVGGKKAVAWNEEALREIIREEMENA